ncbi:MAG: MoaD/ThiS family protein, partial [Anaerolineales bacterium]|nr:MoaD/ThiS family protein [Anaerolineales bacterium]
MRQAHFRFYAELNDFLHKGRRHSDSVHHFAGSPAVKDVIEALGVPHTEVDVILVNGESVPFEHSLKDADWVSVFPVFESLDVSSLIRVRPQPLRQIRFVLDVHLGRLARLLRLFGFDAAYRNDWTDRQLA